MLKKISLLFILSISSLFAVSISEIETEGATIEKTVYENQNLKVVLKKGLFLELSNEIKYLLHITSKRENHFVLDDKTSIDIKPNIINKLVVDTFTLENFINELEKEDAIILELKLAENHYQSEVNKIDKENKQELLAILEEVQVIEMAINAIKKKIELKLNK